MIRPWPDALEEHERRVLDRARDWSMVGEGREAPEGEGLGNAAERRLQPDTRLFSTSLLWER